MIYVQPELYVQISDSRSPQSPSLAQNTSNATTVLPANAPTLGGLGDAILSGLSENPVLASNTHTVISDISGREGEVSTLVSDPPVALPSSAPTIPSS